MGARYGGFATSRHTGSGGVRDLPPVKGRGQINQNGPNSANGPMCARGNLRPPPGSSMTAGREPPVPESPESQKYVPQGRLPRPYAAILVLSGSPGSTKLGRGVMSESAKRGGHGGGGPLCCEIGTRPRRLGTLITALRCDFGLYGNLDIAAHLAGCALLDVSRKVRGDVQVPANLESPVSTR